jgi:hypothetical protein
VRTRQGTITSFDPPGSSGTLAQSIDISGAIAGYYNDANSLPHGFVRSPQGMITSFDPPRASFTYAIGINDLGVITGWYGGFGFLRLPYSRDE